MKKLNLLLEKHNSLDSQVQSMGDRQYTLLYKRINDALLSAENPGVWECYRLKRMVNCFKKSVDHHQKEQKYALSSNEFQA